MIIQKILLPAVLIMFSFMLTSCTEDPPEEHDDTGRVIFHFQHAVNGDPLEIDTLAYVNAAGNQYMITEVQYFISDVELYKSDGSVVKIDDWKDIHYIDHDIPTTMTWELYDPIPAGNYDSIAFTFGINEQKNQSFMYTDPPESLMFWPEFLGGGYHYLKLNGKWLDTLNMLSPFDFHMGIGQVRDNEGNITGFVQNYFRVGLPDASFQLMKDKSADITFVMNIESWFETPHVWDHNHWGAAIMENQEAMQTAGENGRDVFSDIVRIHR